MSVQSVTIAQWFCAFFVGVGLWACLSSAWDMLRGFASGSWPQTTGTILSAELFEELRYNRPQPQFRPIVHYSYVVGGRRFSGKRVYFGDTIPIPVRGPVARRVDRYRIGARVKVAFDSTRPSRSVLEPGLAGPPVYQFMLGCIAAAFATMALLRV